MSYLKVFYNAFINPFYYNVPLQLINPVSLRLYIYSLPVQLKQSLSWSRRIILAHVYLRMRHIYSSATHLRKCIPTATSVSAGMYSPTMCILYLYPNP